MVGRFTNAEKAQEAKREIGQRRYVYKRKVADGTMQQPAADRQLALMEEIAADYEALDALDRPDMFSSAPAELPPGVAPQHGMAQPSPHPPYRYIPPPADPTYNKTPGRMIERGGKFETCRCGEKILRGLVRDALTSTLNTRIWDATPTTHDGQNYYSKHRCPG